MRRQDALEVLARNRGRVESWLRVVSAVRAPAEPRSLVFFVCSISLKEREMGRKKLRRYTLQVGDKVSKGLSLKSVVLELERCGATEQDVDNIMDLCQATGNLTYQVKDDAFAVMRTQ